MRKLLIAMLTFGCAPPPPLSVGTAEPGGEAAADTPGIPTAGTIGGVPLDALPKAQGIPTTLAAPESVIIRLADPLLIRLGRAITAVPETRR